jgi:hypothetical protein
VQAGLDFLILLLQPPGLLGYYRHALPGLAFIKTIESGEMS